MRACKERESESVQCARRAGVRGREREGGRKPAARGRSRSRRRSRSPERKIIPSSLQSSMVLGLLPCAAAERGLESSSKGFEHQRNRFILENHFHFHNTSVKAQ